MDQVNAKISCPACGKKRSFYYSRVGERYRYTCLCGEPTVGNAAEALRDLSELCRLAPDGIFDGD